MSGKRPVPASRIEPTRGQRHWAVAAGSRWLALGGARSHTVHDAKAKAGPLHAFCIQLLLLFFQRRSRSSTRVMPTVRHVIGRCSESSSASALKQECSVNLSPVRRYPLQPRRQFLKSRTVAEKRKPRSARRCYHRRRRGRGELLSGEFTGERT